MQSTTEKLEVLREKALQFGSLGTCPFHLMTAERSNCPLLQHMETYSDSTPMGFSFMVCLFKRTDFNMADLRDYYCFSPEFIDAPESVKQSGIGSILQRIDENHSLASWVDMHMAMFEGYIKALMNSLSLHIVEADAYDIGYLARNFIQKQPLVLHQVYWIM